MKQQFYFYGGGLLMLPLLPLLFLLGKRVRRRVPQLPEAHQNVVGGIAGALPPLRLLALGESTVAGVGVADHRAGITGQLALALAEHTGRAVGWQVLARSGYTAAQAHTRLLPQVPLATAFDFILIGLGANDTFTLRSPLTFRRHVLKLVGGLRVLQPQAQIIIANLPPIAEFPAFPWLMRLVLGQLVKLHGRVIRDVPAQFANVHYVDQPIRFKDWVRRAGAPATIADFFSDGVHPSAPIYALWGQEIGTFITRQGLL